jgi:hypothetical protein
VLSPHGTATRIERRIGLKRIFDRAAGDGILQGAARVLAVSDVTAPVARTEEHIAYRTRSTRTDPLFPAAAFRKRHGIRDDPWFFLR